MCPVYGKEQDIRDRCAGLRRRDCLSGTCVCVVVFCVLPLILRHSHMSMHSD